MNENLSSWADPLIGAVRQILAERPPWPEATYRVQFQPEQFRFRDAAELAPYLKDLGISHLYASPYLKVAPGAEHGYALVDYGHLNPALGTEEDFRAMVATLGEHGLGQIVDFVPNHMNISSAENRWWQDVLENGPSSPHAKYFDIDWNPVKAELRGKVLLPGFGSSDCGCRSHLACFNRIPRIKLLRWEVFAQQQRGGHDKGLSAKPAGRSSQPSWPPYESDDQAVAGSFHENPGQTTSADSARSDQDSAGEALPAHSARHAGAGSACRSRRGPRRRQLPLRTTGPRSHQYR